MASLSFSQGAILSPSAERLLLQSIIAIGGFVPVCFGLAGAVLGGALTGDAGGLGDSQVRFLSGLLVGIGLAYWEAVPQIEVRTARLRLLTLVVMLGGLFRLIGIVFVGGAAGPQALCLALCLVLELVAAPLVCVWQARIARRFGTIPTSTSGG